MNKEWSELNKSVQVYLKKSETFNTGIETLLLLRKSMLNKILELRDSLSDEDLYSMPFKNAKGYHSKSIAYSLWHIFRIEDIVAHTLIKGDEQVFFKDNYKVRTCSPIITTGNELNPEEIFAFSKSLNTAELFSYISDVEKSTTEILLSLKFEDLKKKVSEINRQELENLKVVSNSEEALWLIDYWCGKDIKGLIQMPFSRHWIMHIEACLRIATKIAKA